MNILVTGGAGYIGSHIVKQLLKCGNYKIIIVDNLTTGAYHTIVTLQTLGNVEFINEDLSNITNIEDIIKKNNFDVIIHLAASSIVSESIDNPIKYYMNNTCNTANLINLCNKYNINKFIFSSTAAVYGSPSENNTYLKENDICNPLSPYGYSKLTSEQIIIDNGKSNKSFKYIILRYFNVAGASKELKLGECHEPETHLIPLIVKTALGIRKSMAIFGDDYATNDGTCIRDYIHVDDLANAHISAIEYLKDTSQSNIFNCGYGHGFSVQEVINAVAKISGVDFKVDIADKRDGDPAFLVANNTKILKETTWKPKYDNLEYICQTALNWERKIQQVDLKRVDK
jgi:UDP-glucose 4-epimerase